MNQAEFPPSGVGRQELKEAQINQTVGDIVLNNLSTLIQKQEGKTYSLIRVFNTGLIRDSKMKLQNLPANIRVCTAELKTTDNHTSHTSAGFVIFILIDQTLVPLNTHVLEIKNTVPVFELSEDYNSYVLKTTLANYVLSNIPDNVFLTRVLSGEEAQRYFDGVKIGSRGNIYWKEGLVHTALHNTTSEYINEANYPKLVKFKLSKDKLRELLNQNALEISTYEWVFLDRDAHSPFPFEVEMTFIPEAHEALIEAYRSWQRETGKIVEENPFANYQKR